MLCLYWRCNVVIFTHVLAQVQVQKKHLKLLTFYRSIKMPMFENKTNSISLLLRKKVFVSDNNFKLGSFYQHACIQNWQNIPQTKPVAMTAYDIYGFPWPHFESFPPSWLPFWRSINYSRFELGVAQSPSSVKDETYPYSYLRGLSAVGL